MIEFTNGTRNQEPAEADKLQLVIIADFVPRHGGAGDTPGGPIHIDSASFGAVMQSLAGTARIEVPDPFGGRAPLELEVPLGGPSAFRPRLLLENVAELRALAGVAGVLDQLAASSLEPSAAAERLRQALPRREWAQTIIDALGGGPLSVGQTASAPASGASGGRYSGLLSQLIADAGASARRATPVAGARGVAATALARLLAAILQNSEIQRLERAWQSVRFLLEHCSSECVDVRLLSAEPDGVEDVLQALRSSGEQADLIVVDHLVDADASDLTLLASWAELAESLSVPLVVNGGAGLLGYDSLEQLGRTERRVSSSDDPRAIVTRALAARDSMAWVTVAVNGFLLRPRHLASSVKLSGLTVEHELEPADAALFGGPAILVAALVARSVSRHGHAFAITGADDGAIASLNVRQLDRGDGEEVALPLQTFFGRDVIARIARSGVAAFTSVWNEATAVLAAAPMLYRGPISASDPDPVPPLTLPDQLLASRLSRVLQQVAAAVPAGTPADAITEVTRLALMTVFENAAPPGPEILIGVERNLLTATVRPRRFGDVRVEELSLSAALR